MIRHECVLQEVPLIYTDRSGPYALTYVLDENGCLDLLAAFLAGDPTGVLSKAVTQTGRGVAVLKLVLRAFQLQ